jgi:hypothetical protein
MLASPQGIADHGIFIDSAQACGLADAAAVLEVPEDVQSLLVWQAGAEQGGTFAFGEADLAGAAGEHAALLAGTIAEADAEVALAPQAVIGTVGVLTTKQVKIFHEQHRSKLSGWWTAPRWHCRKTPGTWQR